MSHQNQIVRELRRRFRSPHDVCEALGLDSAILRNIQPDGPGRQLFAKFQTVLAQDASARDALAAFDMLRGIANEDYEPEDTDAEDEPEDEPEEDEMEDDDTPVATDDDKVEQIRELIAKMIALLGDQGEAEDDATGEKTPLSEGRVTVPSSERKQAQDAAIRQDIVRRFPDAARVGSAFFITPDRPAPSMRTPGMNSKEAADFHAMFPNAARIK
jgi:hypothetical protein